MFGGWHDGMAMQLIFKDMVINPTVFHISFYILSWNLVISFCCCCGEAELEPGVEAMLLVVATIVFRPSTLV
jgi:hypothetical protein